MQKDNVTSFNKFVKSQEPASISLKSVTESINAWRLNKKNRNDKIPDSIWDQIFILIETISETRVLAALGIGQVQLMSKRFERAQSKADVNEIEDTSEEIDFCEVKPAMPIAYKPAKAFSTTTSVVELYRPDGMLMKIHMCTDRFEELLSAFFKG